MRKVAACYSINKFSLKLTITEIIIFLSLPFVLLF